MNTFTPAPDNARKVECPLCGHYVISFRLMHVRDFNVPQHILSGVLRNYWENSQTEFNLTCAAVASPDTLEQASGLKIPDVTDITTKATLILKYLSNKSTYPGEIVMLYDKNDYSVGFCQNESEFNFCVEYLKGKGYLEHVKRRNSSEITHNFRITVVGLDFLKKCKSETKIVVSVIPNPDGEMIAIQDTKSSAETNDQSSTNKPLSEMRAIEPIHVMFSYSHEDEKLRNALESHLYLLYRQKIIIMWHDRKISPGQNWAGIIDAKMQSADLILLLISSDFLASNYCYEVEMQTALERHSKQETCVVPVILRACHWKDAPFSAIQGLPKDMKAVTSWSNQDEAWTDVADGIRKVAENLITKRTHVLHER